MTEAQLERLAAEGSIPPGSVAHWRAPRSDEVSPHPRPDEVVSFRIFYVRGLGHPAQPFLLGLLEEWRIGLHHHNPHRDAAHRGFRDSVRGVPQDRSARRSILGDVRWSPGYIEA